MKPEHGQVEFCVVQDDILSFKADVLVLKYAQGFFGVDNAVFERFAELGLKGDVLVVPRGKSRLLPSHGAIASEKILVVGVKDLYEFEYKDIREFARLGIEALAKSAPSVRHCAITLHGAGYGLDEIEAFESEMAGLLEAINSGAFPKALRRISIVEINAGRARRLTKSLESLLPTGRAQTDVRTYFEQMLPEASARLRSAGYASDTKPYVFVAMPFKRETDDVYEYGIQRAVRAAGFVCERADLSTFTGDVVAWIKQRIKSASLVVADLSDDNPNVYLEVGFAWGVGVPTVLLVKDASHLKFDVKTQRCVPYERIKDLEHGLKKELKGLKKRGIEPTGRAYR